MRLLAIAILLSTHSLWANVQCDVAKFRKKIIVNGNKVQILPLGKAHSIDRQIASIQARNKDLDLSLTKILDWEGHKVTLHIEDYTAPSDLSDYLIVRNLEGHEVTYSMECKKI